MATIEAAEAKISWLLVPYGSNSKNTTSYTSHNAPLLCLCVRSSLSGKYTHLNTMFITQAFFYKLVVSKQNLR